MTKRPRRILVSGGGGFTTSIQDLPLDHLLLELAGVERPRICLLPTASGDPEDQIRRFYATFRDADAELCHLSAVPARQRPHACRRPSSCWPRT